MLAPLHRLHLRDSTSHALTGRPPARLSCCSRSVDCARPQVQVLEGLPGFIALLTAEEMPEPVKGLRRWIIPRRS